ncbi:MAG: deoxyribodipyrimidine photo-lyase [Nesterenkonia sp.]|nr:deoxyribodipyrimidine photo-lyase [Nesterenkonia sp.]
MTRTLVWFRDDLRTADHPALHAACVRAAEAGEGSGSGSGDVVALYVLDEVSPGVRALGGAVKWWLHGALESLEERLRGLGVPLLVRSGDPARLVPELAEALGVDRVHWSRRYGGPERDVDAGIKGRLPELGVTPESFPSSLLHEPWTVETQTGGPYKVFTPFWREVGARSQEDPLPEPRPVAEYERVAGAVSGSGVPRGSVSDLDLRPTAPDWAGGLRRTWDPTESGGHRRLETFLQEKVDDYDESRDRPELDGTSGLSPYLRFGQLSPRQVWTAAHEEAPEQASGFLSELGWREFCWHLLYHFPQMPHRNLKAQFDAYPWSTREEQPELFRAWARGETGFAWVDAGQRELWDTGHMHNRVRMASASLLIKNFGIDWREGEAWFWDTLVDADAASNPANWQWVAGCGADAAPYFRIFNPERQLERFDPKHRYVARWIPELGTDDYPEPVVDLAESRREALAHYESIRGR